MQGIRKNPEDFLNSFVEQSKKSTKGKLKIYLGAAPGVGKTYSMLNDAYEIRKNNYDVIVGVVESHGRAMIEEMIGKFDILPRQEVTYRARKYLEFDLDAALKRAPMLILVDEMAHTNISGLRHSKRWQDIKELLDRGIDVYTTLNVQHIESLKDDVAQIINAPIQETVPDFMLEFADKIELVDLPVEDLLARLHDGKIYIPAQLEQAAANFFKPANLTALRELALRVTALHVENQVQSYRKSQGIKEVWSTRDKILVCVNDRPESLRIIRAAKRMALNSQAPLLAVYVDTPNKFYSFKQTRNFALNNLRLAQQLGATTHVLEGKNISYEILNFARENNVTQIVIWKDVKKSWKYWFKSHLADIVVENSNEINVSIITSAHVTYAPSLEKPKYFKTHIKYYWYALVMTGFTTTVNWFLAPVLDATSIMMLYILSVVSVATFGYIGPSIFVSVLSVFCYDFFFIEPILSYAIFNFEEIFTLSFMLLVTYVISYITLAKHNEARLANKNQNQAKELYAFSRELLSTYELDKLVDLGAAYISKIFAVKVTVFLILDGVLQEKVVDKFIRLVDSKEQSIVRWVADMGQPAGLGTDTLAASDALYLPMLSAQQIFGCMKIKPENKELFSPEQLVLLESCIHQFTLAIEVNRLLNNIHQQEISTKVDLTKNNLLKNIAAYLNNPINKIMHTLRNSGSSLDSTNIDLIIQELTRLNILNNNILQITNLESNPISLNKQNISVIELLNLAIANLRKIFSKKEIILHSQPKNVYINADPGLLKKVFDNVLDNANKFSPQDSVVNIYISVEDKIIKIQVQNFAENLHLQDVKNLFKKFYQGKNIPIEQGLGIGLTICQIIIEAHLGKIWADLSVKDKLFTINLELPQI